MYAYMYVQCTLYIFIHTHTPKRLGGKSWICASLHHTHHKFHPPPSHSGNVREKTFFYRRCSLSASGCMDTCIIDTWLWILASRTQASWIHLHTWVTWLERPKGGENSLSLSRIETIFRHASVYSTYPCQSVRPLVGPLVILLNFHSIGVSGCSTWKVEERGSQLFFNFGSG